VRRALLGAAVVAIVVAGCGNHGSTRAANSGGPVVSRAAGTDATADAGTGTAVFTTTTVTPAAAPRATTPQPGLPPPAKPSAAGSSGVQGRVTSGPTCPVEQANNPCPPQPVQGDVVASDGAGRPAGSARTSADGTYSMALPAGSYRLTVSTGSRYPRCPTVDVTVEAGKTARADISCDTGVR
jgi:hypothetical protein